MGAWLCCIGMGHGGAVGMESGAGNGVGLGYMCVEHGGGVDMESEGGSGDCVEEEDEKWWLVIGICNFRRMASSLETMETRVTAEWS